mgnify:CR=1 FL=1
MHSVPGAVALACTSSSGIGPALPGCCRPRGSGPPGAEHVQPRQRASAGQVLARLADVAGWVLQAAGGGAARRRARPAAAAGRGRPDRRPQVSTRKKATGPDRAAGRRRPGARPARRRGRLGAAGRRGRGCPAPSTSSSGSGSGPARSTAAGEHQEEGHGARPGSRPASARCSPSSRTWPAGRRGRGRPVPSTSSSGSGPALARCSPSSRTWPAVEGVGAARCRARPAGAAGQRWPGARRRGQQVAGVGVRVVRGRAHPATAAAGPSGTGAGQKLP